MSSSTIGIDISKDALDAYRMSGGASRRFANDRTGHGALIAWIGGEAERVVFEPTGPDHRAFERALAKAGRQARQGQPPSGAPLRGGDRQARPKTDRLAAAPLARMGALLEREARPVRGPVPAALKEPHVAREALVRDRAAARNRAKAPAPPLLRRRNAARRKHIERRTGAIEARMMRRIKAGPALGKRFGILARIPGVSRLTAFALLIEMPEPGTREAAQAASLAGLASVARQSGRWTGRAFIRGRRASVRKALSMPALVAARFNPGMKAKHARLAAAGKAALTAIMRKLLVLANALPKSGKTWTTNPA